MNIQVDVNFGNWFKYSKSQSDIFFETPLRWSFWYNIHGVYLVCELSLSQFFWGPLWPKLELLKSNYMCIIVSLKWSFWDNIHGVHLVCELSQSQKDTKIQDGHHPHKQTSIIAYYCPSPASSWTRRKQSICNNFRDQGNITRCS